MDKRVRSPNYPALSLPEAIVKVAQVYGEIQTHAAPREVIAKAMGYTGLNGASATAISALHKYGLLERLGNEEIKVSDRALQISHPHSPQERTAAIHAAAKDPVLFAELYEKFPGKLPNEDLLRNYLVRKGFAQSALSHVISAFRETSEMVAAEDLVYDSPVNKAEEPSPVMQHQPSDPVVSRSAPTIAPAAGASTIASDERLVGRYEFEGGGYVRIAASGDIDTEEALEMVETLIALKRAEIGRKNKRTIAQAPLAVSGDEKEDGDLQ